MKMKVELFATKDQYLRRTIVVEAPDGTPPESLDRVCWSVFERFTVEDEVYLWEDDDVNPVVFDCISSVEASEDNAPDLRLIPGKDGSLVPETRNGTSEWKTVDVVAIESRFADSIKLFVGEQCQRPVE